MPPVNTGKDKVSFRTSISCRERPLGQDYCIFEQMWEEPSPTTIIVTIAIPPTQVYIVVLSPSFQSPCWRGQQRVPPVSPVPTEALQNSTCLLSVCLCPQASSAELKGQDLSVPAACPVPSLPPSITTELALLYLPT